MTATTEGGDLTLKTELRDVALDRDVVLSFEEKAKDEARFSTVTQDGAKYLLLRYRPDLAAPKEPQRRDHVIVVEASGDRDPLLARTQIELVRSFLQNAGRDDTFVVLTAGTRAAALSKEPLRNAPAAVAAALAALATARSLPRAAPPAAG